MPLPSLPHFAMALALLRSCPSLLAKELLLEKPLALSYCNFGNCSDTEMEPWKSKAWAPTQERPRLFSLFLRAQLPIPPLRAYDSGLLHSLRFFSAISSSLAAFFPFSPFHEHEPDLFKRSFPKRSFSWLDPSDFGE